MQIKGSKFLLIILQFAMVASSGCNRGSGVPSHNESAISEKTVGTNHINDMTSHKWEMADSITEQMSLEERVGQCFMPSIMSSADEGNLQKMKRYIHDLHVGGVILLKGDVESATVLSDLGRKGNCPLFMAIDAEWGLGMRLSDASLYPKNIELGKIADESEMYDYGREIARQCREIGINMILGPVVDVSANPRGFIGKRSFGGDPKKVADLGVAYAKGLESGGVISVAKHFPGHGSQAVDSHYSMPVISKSLHMLDSTDFYPFRKYIDSGLSGVMVGHLSLPAIDSEPQPSAVSARVIKDLLKDELGFEGLVLTDAMNMGGASHHSAADALKAGADLVISPAETKWEIENVIEEIRIGKIDIEDINSKCKKIIFYKLLTYNLPVSI